MKNIQENILNKIKSGEVDMKPRWHFLLRSLLLVLGVLIVALIGVYLLSFVLFTLRQSGVSSIPLYSFRGISQFVISSPWLLSATVGAFVLLLQVLVSKYSFSYRRPLLYSAIGIALIVLVGSFVIEQTTIHPRIQQFTEQHNTPLLAPMYRDIQNYRPDNLILGTITEVQETGFIIESDTKETLTVIINEDTHQPRHATFTKDDTVSVLGEREEDTVTADGIKPLSHDPPREAGKKGNNWDEQSANVHKGRPNR